jgi:hypothetical protein
MSERRFQVGERVLVSRAEDGAGHEQATVADAYELLVNGEKRPTIVVDFADGKRAWLTVTERNVRPLPLPDAAEAPSDGQELSTPDAGARGAAAL